MPTVKFYWGAERPIGCFDNDICIPSDQICKGDRYESWENYFDLDQVRLERARRMQTIYLLQPSVIVPNCGFTNVYALLASQTNTCFA